MSIVMTTLSKKQEQHSRHREKKCKNRTRGKINSSVLQELGSGYQNKRGQRMKWPFHNTRNVPESLKKVPAEMRT